MKLARRWNRRAASSKTRRKATKEFIRRGLSAERLEDRTLMAADLSSYLASGHSNFYNFGKPNDVNADGVVAPNDLIAIISNLNGYGAHELSSTGAEGESHLFLDTNNDGYVSPLDMMRVITQLNAEGETGAPLANYTITLYPDATSTTPITSIGQNSDFYMAISAADLRPDGTYGDGVTPLLRGIVGAYTDVNFDKSFVQVAVSEVQNLKITTAGSGTFTLSANGKTSPSIPYDTTNVANTATAIQNALNDSTMLSAGAVTVKAIGTGVNANYRITFGRVDELNVNQTQLQASVGAPVTMSTLTEGDPTILASFDSAFQFNSNIQVTDTNGVNHQYAYNIAQRPSSTTNPPSTADGANGLVVVGATQSQAFTDQVSLGNALIEVVRIHMIAPTLPNGVVTHTVTFNPDASVTDYYFTGNTITRTGDTNTSSTDGVANVTGLSSTADLAVNMLVTAPGFNQNTKIAQIIDGTSIQVTPAPGVAVAGNTITFNPPDPNGQGSTYLSKFLTLEDGNQVPGKGFDLVDVRDDGGVLPTEISYTPAALLISAGPIHADNVHAPGINEDPGTADTINLLSHTGFNTGGIPGTIRIKSVQGLTAGTPNNGLPPGTVALSADGTSAVFTPGQNYNGTTTFTYTAVHVLANGQDDTDPNATVTATVEVDVAAVNDKPVVTAPSAPSVQENAGVTFNGNISVSDVDFAEAGSTNVMHLDLLVPQGTLTLSPATPGTLTVSGNNTAHITADGTLADINTALNGLHYTATDTPSASVALTIQANDNGNVGSGGAQTGSATVTLNITAQNDAPINLLNGTALPADGTHVVALPNTGQGATVFANLGSTFSIDDPDTTSGLTTTLTLSAAPNNTDIGTLSASNAGGATVSGNGTAASPLTISGTKAQINAALLTLAITPPTGSVQPEALDMLTNDHDTLGALSTDSKLIVDLDPGYRPGPIADSNTALGLPITEGDTSAAATITLDVLANDFLRDKDPNLSPAVHSTISAVSTPLDFNSVTRGSVAIVNNKLVYTPPAVTNTNADDSNFFTPDAAHAVTFTYTVTDDYAGTLPDANGHGNAPAGKNVATVSILITNSPDKPTSPGVGPYNAFFANGAGATVTVAAPGLLTNAHDVDNDFGNTSYATLTPVLQGANGGAAHGTVTLDANGDGGFTYKPTSFDPANPDDHFTYVVHAVTPQGAIDSDPINVTVHVFGTTDHFDVFEQNTDPNGGALNQSGNVFANNNPGNFTATIASQPAHGTIALNPNGTFTYSPEAAANFNTTRPVLPDLSFTYTASGNGVNQLVTVGLTVKEVNDPPTAVNDDNVQTDGIIVVKSGADRPGVGVNQLIDVTANDSVAPDSPTATATSLGSESVSVVGVSFSATGPFGTTDTVAGSGTVKLVNGQVLYDSPDTIPAGDHVTIYYKISDNSDPSRGGPLFATASARLHVVDFIPKTVGGTVFVDGNGDGVLDNGEKALADVNVTIQGTSFTGAAVNVTVTTDANGQYSIKPNGLGLAPPDANGYKITEQALIGLIDGPAVENPNSQLVNIVNRAFILNWGITDTSGDIGGLDFTEVGFDTRSTSQGGTLSSASGFKQEYLASSGSNGFVFDLNADGTIGWYETLNGLNTPNAWVGTTQIKATLSSDLSQLKFTWNGQTANLTQGYSLAGIGITINGVSYSTARFRILGIGANGQYIIRVDGSSGSTSTTPDGMFVMNGAGGEGEAAVNQQYANSADAVFSEGAWA